MHLLFRLFFQEFKDIFILLRILTLLMYVFFRFEFVVRRPCCVNFTYGAIILTFLID